MNWSLRQWKLRISYGLGQTKTRIFVEGKLFLLAQQSCFHNLSVLATFLPGPKPMPMCAYYQRRSSTVNGRHIWECVLKGTKSMPGSATCLATSHVQTCGQGMKAGNTLRSSGWHRKTLGRIRTMGSLASQEVVEKERERGKERAGEQERVWEKDRAGSGKG